MKHKVTEQWRPNGDDLCILCLDSTKLMTSANDDYRFYRIGGVIYKPVQMLHTNGKCIAIKSTGDFVGKEVEFIRDVN